MIEHERSYVFTYDGFEHLFPKLCEISSETDIAIIEDCYLDRGVRVRKIEKPGASKSFVMTEKQGKKSDGYRIENEFSITEDAYNVLSNRAKLHVKKTRQHVDIGNPGYDITVDRIAVPMGLVVMEVEAKTESAMPVNEKVLGKLFNVEANPCPLSAFQLFNRKIGICGGPSAGKSETAKALSHSLNTVYGANSFYVTEFATTFIQKYKRQPTFYDQPFIWFGQREREKDAETSNIVISDCPTFLSYIYMLLLNNQPLSPETALHLSKIYKRILFDLQTYTDIILMEIQEYRENGVRYHDLKSAKRIEGRIKNFLDDHGVKYSIRKYQDADDGSIIKDLFFINR